jgi:predicted HTH domain antitoxin
MTIEISDRILEKSGLTPAKLRLELAIILFQRESLTLGQASKIAGLHQLQFQRELAKRKIPIHYDVDDFEKDIATLKGSW